MHARKSCMGFVDVMWTKFFCWDVKFDKYSVLTIWNTMHNLHHHKFSQYLSFIFPYLKWDQKTHNHFPDTYIHKCPFSYPTPPPTHNHTLWRFLPSICFELYRRRPIFMCTAQNLFSAVQTNTWHYTCFYNISLSIINKTVYPPSCTYIHFWSKIINIEL